MEERERIMLLDETYARLAEKRRALAKSLAERFEGLQWGYYAGHYERTADGGFQKAEYPIPVITVQGIGDIEIHLDRLSISANLGREEALLLDPSVFEGRPFEAYGVDDFLADYHRPGDTVEKLRENISRSQEAEIGFAFPFPFSAEPEEIAAFLEVLQKQKFRP